MQKSLFEVCTQLPYFGLSPDISKLGRRKGKKFTLVYRLQSVLGVQQQKLQGEKLDPGTQEESTGEWSIGAHCLISSVFLGPLTCTP